MRFRFAFVLALLLFVPAHARSEELAEKLKTQWSTIHFTNQEDLGTFLWRISGKRLDPLEARELVKGRVDEIVERVKSLLDMYPPAFHVDIFLDRVPRGGNIALYSHPTRSIQVLVSRVTDGVLAHEVSHAVMCGYFKTPPPEKMQEVLAQYVDRNLWSEV